MAALFIEGFDKYGPANSNGASVSSALTANEWTTASSGATSVNIAAPLSATGYSLQFGANGNVVKTLAANYSRLIGGVRFLGTLVNTSTLIQFRDGASAQCWITMESTGVIHLRTGGSAGTDINTGATISANTTHYLEWDITFAASGAYTVYLDGASLFSGTGNTRGGTSNNFANAMALVQG